MKKFLLSVFALTLLLTNLHARRVPGKIISQGKVVNVTIKIPSFTFFMSSSSYEQLQYKVKYFDEAGNKHILRPDYADEIQFEDGGQLVRMLSRPNTLNLGNIFNMSKNIFLKLEVDGELKLFSYFYTSRSPGMYTGAGMMMGGYTYTVERFILQKGNGNLKRPRTLTFRKDMADYFSDCPDLVNKIENKYFKQNDLNSMVAYYNAYCY